MKKIVIASILGVAACAAVNKAQAQGSLFFSNYSLGSVSYSAPVTYGGLALDSAFSAQLLYSSTGTSGTFTAVGSATPFFASVLGDTADGAGWINGEGVTVSSYPNVTSQNAYFEMEAYNTATVNGFAPGTIVGYSPVVELSALATAANLGSAGDLFPDNPNLVGSGLQSFVVVSVPEPATLALLGLGAAGLLGLRRKQS
jgi:PEP-CTERM motif